MPIYEYRCTSCGRPVEVVHSIHGTGPEACEVCGGAMRKALTTPAIVFKGSGWAKKDARSSTPVAAANPDGPSDGATASSDGATAKPSADTSTKEAAPSPPASASGSKPSGAAKPSGGAAKSGKTDRSA